MAGDAGKGVAGGEEQVLGLVAGCYLVQVTGVETVGNWRARSE